MSSTRRRWLAGIIKVTASILVSLLLYLKGVCRLASTDHSAYHSTAGVSDDAGDLLWFVTVSKQFPAVLSVKIVERLLIVNNADAESGVPFA